MIPNALLRRLHFIICLICISLFYPLSGFGQLWVHGNGFYIHTDTVAVTGDMHTETGIEGQGTLMLNGSQIQHLDCNGAHTVSFFLDNPMGIRLIENLQIENALMAGRGWLDLGDHTLTIGSGAQMNGFDEQKPVYTTGLGYLEKINLGTGFTDSFLFPVSTGPGHYQAVSIRNSGQADRFRVRVFQDNNLPAQAPAGHRLLHSWDIQETVPGGSDVSVRSYWQLQDETADFNRSQSGMVQYNSSRWNLPANRISHAVSQSPFYYKNGIINGSGRFTVADAQWANRVYLNLKVYLQGAFSGQGISAGLMRDRLRQQQAIPLIQPYGNGQYAHAGLQGGTETITGTTLSNQPDPANDIVDWIFVSLLDTIQTQTALQTRAALLQRDGDIVDLDGTSPVSMPVHDPGYYRIGIGHRNHLRIRTADDQLIFAENGTVIIHDFTQSQSGAHQDAGIQSNPAMISVQQGTSNRFCMIGGNTDGDQMAGNNRHTVSYAGSGNDRNPLLANALGGNPNQVIVLNEQRYSTQGKYDLNLDGVIQYAGSGNDPFIILQALGGNHNLSVREHY